MRKRDALEQRQPLTDIFAPNTQAVPTPAKNTAFYDKVTQFQIAEDGENLGTAQRPLSRSKSPQRVGKPGNTDSGYHGMTEDEMEVDAQTDSETVPSQEYEAQQVPLRDDQAPAQRIADTGDESARTSDGSFVSAKDSISRNASKEQLREEPEDDNGTNPDDDMDVDQEVAAPAADENEDEENIKPEPDEEEPEAAAAEEDQDLDAEMSHEASDASSPEKPLQRKSSFTFSSLPAREPLTAKRSMGGRTSQMDAPMRNSVLARSLGKSFGAQQLEDGEAPQERAEEGPTQGKTSTQLLQERITMLGKTKEPRSSKSIPQSALYPQLPQADADEMEVDEEAAPQPPPKDAQESAAPLDDDDDDWIAPSKPAQTGSKQPERLPPPTAEAQPARPPMHAKSISTTKLPSPTREIMAPPKSPHHKAMSVSNPNLVSQAQSTTPAGSPVSKKQTEAPMSASKKLWNTFKSARNLFASSAGSSAAAKLEAHSSSPMFTRKQKRDFSDESRTAAIVNMPGALYSESQFPQSPSRPVSVAPASPTRKTRSSTESDKRKQKEMKAQQKAADELEKAREKERQKVAKAQEEKLQAEQAEIARKEKEQQEAAAAEAAAAAAEAASAATRPASADKDREDMPPPPPPKTNMPTGKLRAPGRLMRPTRANTNAAKPAPVNIRVASQSQRMNTAPSQSSFSSSSQESMAPPPPPKTGLRTTSAQGNARGSTMPANNSRVKALEAAARKKEQEEREKQRKAEQKRELERKRAAKAEEDRRAEQERKAEEQRKLQEAKMAAQQQAQKQAAEAKRREQQRLEQQRLEQQRLQEAAAQKAKAAHDLAEAIARERAQQVPPPRGDVGGTLRQLSQKVVPAPNPAKPAKRHLQNEDDEITVQQPQRPGVQRNPPSYQQNEAKRRKTEDVEQEQDQRHSVMAPPKRPSTMRKVGPAHSNSTRAASLTSTRETLTKFPHGYSHAPPPAAHHASSMFKSTVSAQHQMQHGQRPVPAHPSQTVQMSNARIPFAENANPPAQQHYGQHPQQYAGHENTAPGTAASSRFKTPARPPQNPKSAKNTPTYTNGDAITLPEIMTDSEDEDEDSSDENTGFRAPSWVASPALRDLLTQQQLVDPETVFGPIGELKMEEVFKGAKNQERLKRFRDRGSSALWVETGDRVTEEEKRRDLEGRERLVREGGWRYEGAGAGGR